MNVFPTELNQAVTEANLKQIRHTTPSVFLEKFVKDFPQTTIKNSMISSAKSALIEGGNNPDTLMFESPRFATKVVGNLGIRLSVHIDGKLGDPPNFFLKEGEIHGIGIEIFNGKTYNDKKVLYEALWSCPSTSTPFSPFVVDETGNQVDMDALFTGADGFFDWTILNNQNRKKYSLFNLREIENSIRTRNGGIASIDDYLNDPEWREVSAGIWQGYRLLAANLLAWKKNKIVKPSDLKINFLPKELDNIAL